jgi:hypothetical protein
MHQSAMCAGEWRFTGPLLMDADASPRDEARHRGFVIAGVDVTLAL